MLSMFYPPVGGGGEKHVQMLSQELAQRGHDVLVLALAAGGARSYHDGSVKVREVGGLFQKFPALFGDRNRRIHPPMPDPLIVRAIGSAMNDFRPDVVHSHHGWLTYSALWSKKVRGVPLVATLHGHELICPTSILLRNDGLCEAPFTLGCVSCRKEGFGFLKMLMVSMGIRLNKSRMRLVDKFIAVSTLVKKVHSQHLGLDESKFVVIPNFYKPEIIEQSKNELQLPDDFILFVGDLAAYKGVDVLLRAYEMVSTEARLVLIGKKHPSFSYSGSERIVIIENAPHDLVMEAWQACRFGVVPSICPETGPIVALEAMSEQKAVIASRIGGPVDIVDHEKTGLLFPPGDANALAEAMQQLLDDEQLAARMGSLGCLRLEKTFSPAVVVPQIEELYSQLRH